MNEKKQLSTENYLATILVKKIELPHQTNKMLHKLKKKLTIILHKWKEGYAKQIWKWILVKFSIWLCINLVYFIINKANAITYLY